MSEHHEHSSGDRSRKETADRIRRAFADRLHAEATQSGKGLRELARLMSNGPGWTIPPSTLSDKITGKSPVDWKFVKKLLEACYLGRDGTDRRSLTEWRADYDEMKLQVERLLRGKPGWPYMVGLVPRQASAFQARGAAAQVRALLSGNTTVVISGLDGVGKTQLAAGLVWEMWHGQKLDVVIWVRGASRSTILTDMAEAARVMHISDDADASTAARRLLATLSEPSTGRWLLVFDDLMDPADLRGLWPPATDRGNTIVTTNRQDAAFDSPDRAFVHLGAFKPEESSRYLQDRIQLSPDDRQDAELLAEELGHLPIALGHAAAHMRNNGLSCRTYRERLHGGPLVDAAPESLLDDHPEPLAQTWELSVTRADELPPRGLARPVLEVAVQLDNNGVPIELFTSAAANQHLARRRGLPTTKADIKDALHSLSRLSLVQFDASSTWLLMNRIVQRAVRESLSAVEADEAATVAADALFDVWPDVDQSSVPNAGPLNDQSIEVERGLRSNAFALLEQAPRGLWQGHLHQVIYRAGTSLAHDGLLAEPVEFWERLLPVAAERLGPDHADTFIIRNNRAWAYGRAGDPDKALNELRELLPDRERVLGPHDVNTLATRHGIAYWLHESGDTGAALTAMQEVLADYLALPRPEPRDVLNTRLSLALWSGETEGPDVAVAGLRELADDYRDALGPDRPETLDVVYHLAYWLGCAGRLDEALALADRLRADCTRALRADHIDTFAARRLHALLLREADAEDRALDELRATYGDLVRVYGSGHQLALTIADEL